MTWKQEIGAFRKAVTHHLKPAGYIYTGQNNWERPFQHWRGRIGVEWISSKRGQSRRLFRTVELVKSVRLSEQEAKQAEAFLFGGCTVYYVYSLDFPWSEPRELLVPSPDLVTQATADFLHALDSEWLPWLASTAATQGTSVAGCYRYTAHVHPSTMFVP